jgi:protein tyrosine phosphatase (PTP) superfamily phosphohydrolase (DUF442 family)
MSVSEIVNFIAIDDKIGTAGQPTREQFPSVRDAGYEAVVNLLPSVQDNALKGEDEVVRSLGLDYHYIPVVWTDPKPADFVAFCTTMRALKGKKVFVHCAMNMRVTAFYSTYAMKYLGWNVQQADALIARIWEANPNYQMPAVWRAFIETIRR